MKLFQLILQANDMNGKIFFREVIDADNLVETYSRLLIHTARLQELMAKQVVNDDDIPF